MLGRKTYTTQEIDTAQRAVEQQLRSFRTLAAAVADDPDSAQLLDDFEVPYFNNMTIVLDRYFVHRIRPVTGKDSNPLNEVELVADSLMNNQGVLRVGSVIKHVPEQTILKLQVGEQIRLTADTFESLAAGFFAELDRRFVESDDA